MPAAARWLRLCAGLTAVGGMLVIAGIALGLAGETARLDGGRGWHPIVGAAGILLAAGLSCGAALVAAVAAWRLSVRWYSGPARGQADVPGSRPDDPDGGARKVRWTAPQRSRPPVQGGAGLEAAGLPPAQQKMGLPPAQQKMTQIKDLYREVERMGDAEVTAHWEELRQRQHELIRQYFEQAKGSADAGQTAG
jgi:hypothetical protein